MSKAITIRVDETVKQRAEETLDEIGLNMTTKQQDNADYIAKLDDSIEQAERGEVVMYTKAQMRAMEETQ